jgi:integrase
LRPAQVRAILAALASKSNVQVWVRVRDVALVWLLYKTGLRIAEALALKPADIDWTDEPKVSVFVAHGKGDKARKVSLAIGALPAIKGWLNIRERRGFHVEQPIFCSGTGARLDTSHVRRMFRRLRKDSKLNVWVHAHGMRHTYAVEAARKKVAPEMLRRQLGHDDLGTTTRYLQSISADEVMDALWDL